MRKSHLNLLLTGITALYLLSACSEERSVSQDDKTKGNPEPVKISKTADQDTKTTTNDAETPDTETTTDDLETPFSVMNDPVNFSTPENIEETIALIRSEGGEAALSELKRAVKVIWRKDPTVGKSKTSTYERIDGLTPNEIIDLAKQMR